MTSLKISIQIGNYLLIFTTMQKYFKFKFICNELHNEVKYINKHLEALAVNFLLFPNFKSIPNYWQAYCV